MTDQCAGAGAAGAGHHDVYPMGFIFNVLSCD